MKTTPKKLEIGKKVSKITLEHYQNKDAETELKAIYLLLGAYNPVGRHIDYEQYKQLKAKFEDVLFDAKQLISA